MRIILNGRPQEAREGARVAELVAAAGADPERRGIAVAVDGEVVPRSAWEETALSEGQRVEVLQAMQGG